MVPVCVYWCIYACQAAWMMWNWYVTSLAIGSAIVCYDGSPFMPHDSVLFDLVDKIGFVALLLCMPHLVFIFIKFYCIRCLICGKRCTVSHNYLFICTLPLSIGQWQYLWVANEQRVWVRRGQLIPTWKCFRKLRTWCSVTITMVNSSSQADTQHQICVFASYCHWRMVWSCK